MKSLLGVEIVLDNEKVWLVAGLNPCKGITIADPDQPELRCCITPEYFGAGYAGAYFETVRMLKKGFLSSSKLNKYATIPIEETPSGEDLDVIELIKRARTLPPNCPFA